MGRAFLRMLVAKEAELRHRYDVTWRLTGVATRRFGWLADPRGFNPRDLLNGHPALVNAHATPQRGVREWLERAQANVLFEATSLNTETGQPAIEHLRAALERGAHAISANKGPILHAWSELSALAREKGKRFLYESTVMDGVPIFSLFSAGLPATELRAITGVLNSTTNVVLTEIEKGRTFEEAVRHAQALGIAEADPTHDLDGWDAAVKLAALVIVLMGVPLRIGQVRRSGIRELNTEKIRSARASGMRYKLVCRATRHAAGVEATVQPELLPLADSLAHLEGASSAVRFDLDVFSFSLVEHDPGIEATAYGLLADFLRAVKS